MWTGIAAAALASRAVDKSSQNAPGTDNEKAAVTQVATEAESPVTQLDPQFRRDFQTAYGAVLWRMMVLRWCDKRWNRPTETSAAEARLAAIDALAIRWGLKAEMIAAGNDNAKSMAVMRLDVHCNGGFDPIHASALEGLGKLERPMRDLPKPSHDQGSA